jgi:cell division protein FtsZ
LGDEVRITVIAAGFDGGEPTYRKFEAASLGQAALAAAAATAVAAAVEETVAEEVEAQESFSLMQPVEVSVSQSNGNSGFGDDLDLPEFFR